MKARTRSSLAFGFLLILAGAWFLAVQLIPQLNWFWSLMAWPVIIIGVAVFLLLLGLILRAPGMAIPACVVGGIGGMLYWQNATGNWESWAYAWPLIPSFVGIGLMLMTALGGGNRETFRVGAWMTIISLTVYAIFGAFFGASVLGSYWPVLLILLGLWVLIQPLFRRMGKPEPVQADLAEPVESVETIESIEPEDIGEDL